MSDQRDTSRFDAALEVLRAPPSPDSLKAAISTVEEESAEGRAEASELLALFEAMGISRPQSWDGAFDRLQLAAEQGGESARRQLLILAEGKFVEEGGDRDWASIRCAVSLDRLLAHGDRESLSDSPRIRLIKAFATPSECRWLIEEARPRLERATVIKKTGDHGIAEGRSNSGTAFQVIEMDVVLEIIRTRIAAATRVPVPLFEPTQILHYSVGQEFRPHHDFLDPANADHRQLLSAGQRIATFLVYLNDQFEGGETDFPAIGLRYRGGIGDAIFWANLDGEAKPDPLTIHAGLAPTSGEKWILSQWIRDRAGPPAASR